MRTTRRALVCGGILCAAGLHVHRDAWAQGTDADAAEDDDLVVCTADETVVQDQVAIQDFAAGESLVEIETKLKELQITDFGTAMLNQRWRPRDGLTPNTRVVTLGCSIMTGSARDRQIVEESAQGWLRSGIEDLIRFDFTVPVDRAQIRIFIGQKGNNSKIGREALQTNKAEPTMKLQTVRAPTIQHEFGHALGMRHEHQNPAFPVKLREQAIIEELGGPPNQWSEAKTRLNIISKLGSEAKCVGDPRFNPNSIMMYDMPARWTADGKPLIRASRIDDRDFACVKAIYSA